MCGHEHPDGDCLGAEIALYYLLTAQGQEVHILNPDPVAPSLEFMLERTPVKDYKTTRQLPDSDVVVLLDCSDLSRLGELGTRIREKAPLIAVIDHHVGTVDGDGRVLLVDESASAAGALVYALYKQLDIPIPEAAAEGIFLSIVSDTGWFRYSNTDNRTLCMAAEMVKIGVEPAAMFDRLHRCNDARSLEILATSLASHQIRIGGRYVFVVLDREVMSRANRSGFDMDQVLEPIRSIEGIEIAALFKELYDGGVKLSLRARGDVDVQAIAKVFGGGGHRKAAGASLSTSLEESIKAVERQVRFALEKA